MGPADGITGNCIERMTFLNSFLKRKLLTKNMREFLCTNKLFLCKVP